MLKRAIEREWKIKKSKSSNITYKGGRPSTVRNWFYKYVIMKEGHRHTFKDEEEFWTVAKIQLSQTTFWRLKK